MQDPEPYLEAREIELRSFFDGDRPAVLDVVHRARVNYELFFFAGEDERQRFEADPLAYCGPVTDPVTYARFQPGPDSPRIDHNGQPFYFESSVSSAVFSTMPDSFLVPNYKMPTMHESPTQKENDGP